MQYIMQSKVLLRQNVKNCTSISFMWEISKLIFIEILGAKYDVFSSYFFILQKITVLCISARNNAIYCAIYGSSKIKC